MSERDYREEYRSSFEYLDTDRYATAVDRYCDEFDPGQPDWPETFVRIEKIERGYAWVRGDLGARRLSKYGQGRVRSEMDRALAFSREQQKRPRRVSRDLYPDAFSIGPLRQPHGSILTRRLQARLSTSFDWYEHDEGKDVDMRTTLHKDGAQLSIVTTAEDEAEFRGQFSQALARALEADEAPAEVAIDAWLRPATEILCKFRGYKADVIEQRTLIAGHIDPNAELVIATRGSVIAESNGAIAEVVVK